MWGMNVSALFDDVGSFDAAMDVLAGQIAALGFDALDYGYLPVARTYDGAWATPAIAERNLPQGWNRLWSRYSAHDPYLRACYRLNAPLDWREVKDAGWLKPIQRQCVSYLEDVGFLDAITVPLHLPGLRFAFVTASVTRSGYDWSDLAPRSAVPLLLLAHGFQQWVSHHARDERPLLPAPLLSPRERECLHWAAAGKNAPETAVILDRSVETVRRHLKNAMAKLDAPTLAGAVARAGACGLIALPGIS